MNSGLIPDDHRTHVPEIRIRRGQPDRESRPYVDIKVADFDGEILFERKVYVEPIEWRPAARRREVVLTGGWSTYEAYSDAIEKAAQSVRDRSGELGQTAIPSSELSITISSTNRFDLDNVAILVNGLASRVLDPTSESAQLDEIVRQVTIRHEAGSDECVRFTVSELG